MLASTKRFSWKIERLLLLITCCILTMPTASAWAGVCPAIGQDTDCGVLITITKTGATISFTGQGPFDGIEDTLVGVINNSQLPIKSIDIAAALPVFAFDGDGLRAYGLTNAQDSTGYGGQNAYFTKTTGSSGRVNFITPIAANGGVAFFSLEQSLTSAIACPSILNKALQASTGGVLSTNGKPTSMLASFTPKLGYTLLEAAQLCGFTNFDWQQKVTLLPKPSPFTQRGNPVPLTAPPEFFDPPPGGYDYQSSVDLSYPFYLDAITNGGAELLAAESGGYTLTFSDSPADSCLSGGAGNPKCNGKFAPKGSYVAFTTRLMGILPTFTGGNCVALGTCIDLGLGFKWRSNFNGRTTGGVAQLKGNQAIDASSGTGGAQITSIQDTTTYNGIAVTAVNGQSLGVTATLTDGSACNGLYTGSFVGDIRVLPGQSCSLTNASISGNIHVMGGTLTLAQTAVSGDVHANQGSISSISESMVNGNINIEQLQAKLTSELCDSLVYGSIHAEENLGTLTIGSADPQKCGGNVIGGSVELESNRGATFVNGNTITKELECEHNAAINGSENSAQEKEGQCRGF